MTALLRFLYNVFEVDKSHIEIHGKTNTDHCHKGQVIKNQQLFFFLGSLFLGVFLLVVNLWIFDMVGKLTICINKFSVFAFANLLNIYGFRKNYFDKIRFIFLFFLPPYFTRLGILNAPDEAHVIVKWSFITFLLYLSLLKNNSGKSQLFGIQDSSN